MARKCIVVGYVLLQSLLLIGSEVPSGKLRRSSGTLSKSSDDLSRSQELKKADMAAAATFYYDSPCGGGRVNVNKSGSDYRHDMKPYPQYFGGCP